MPSRASSLVSAEVEPGEGEAQRQQWDCGTGKLGLEESSVFHFEF